MRPKATNDIVKLPDRERRTMKDCWDCGTSDYEGGAYSCHLGYKCGDENCRRKQQQNERGKRSGQGQDGRGLNAGLEAGGRKEI